MRMNRRSFLKWAAFAGLTSVVGWRFLSSSRAAIFAAVFATVTGDEDAASSREAVEFLDKFAGELSAASRFELRAALYLVEHSTLIFGGYLGRFSKLDATSRAKVLEGWRTGAQWRRPVFGALKDLSYLALYSRPSSWKAIGYDGPLVPASGRGSPFDARYVDLVVKR